MVGQITMAELASVLLWSLVRVDQSQELSEEL